MSYTRFINDVHTVCNATFAEVADKTTEKLLNKNLTLVLNYYKLIYPILFAGESVSVKLVLNEDNIGSIQLILSPTLEAEYNKRR